MIPELHILEPYAAVLALPAMIAWWYWARRDHGRWLRLGLLLLLVIAAMRIELAWERGGSDVVLILDRSASMGEARKKHDEMVRLAAEQRRHGDRLAVIISGDGAYIAQGPQRTGIPTMHDVSVPDTASDITAALEQAATLLSPGRTGRVLVHSDGEITGPDPRASSTRIALHGLSVDVLPQARRAVPDAAVIDVTLPQSLRLGESFIASARLMSDADEIRTYRVMRQDKLIAEGTVHLLPFAPITINFSDRPPQAGVVQYSIAIDTDIAGAIAARFIALGQKAAAMLPPGQDTAKFLVAFEQITTTPMGRKLFTSLAVPGPEREAMIKLVIDQATTEMGPVLASMAEPLIRQTLEDPVIDRDRQPANNLAKAALRVAGGERILVMGGDGTDSNIVRALRSSGMQVDHRPEGVIAIDQLLAYRVLVLDQVPADRLGLPGMEAIARWVEHLGGGLVLTGGRRSFGAGGYHKSPIERVLPVTMELRDEHRKVAVAMAITLDRSGSMMAPVADGRTKMDLANEGAAAVIELLGPRDLVAVHAVDSSPHIIIPLSPVTDPKDLISRTLGIRSQGGGIYVYQALVAAGKELVDAKTGTRHLVLFADAADAEEPGDYKKLLADYVAAGITVSVVAMGNAKDVDAQFLEDVAQLGRGRIAFAEVPEDIPRLFAQETMLVARSSWISDPVTLQARARLQVDLGQNDIFTQPWPTVAGYNLSYIRDRAHIWAMAPGDPAAPAIASWFIGSGRSVALCINVDDPESPAFMAWNGYAPLMTSIVRWCSGGDVGPGQLTAERFGRTVTLHLDLDPAMRDKWPLIPPTAIMARDQDVAVPTPIPMVAIDDGRYEAHITLADDRTVIPAVTINNEAILGPAVRLPYHPEAEPRYGKTPGTEILASIARAGNGSVRSDLVGLFDNPMSPGQLIDITPLLLTIILMLFVCEIATRRLQITFYRSKTPMTPVVVSTPVAPIPIPAASVSEIPKMIPPTAPGQDDGLHEALRQLRKRK